MNFAGLFKAFDTLVVLREAARRFTANRPSPPAVDQGAEQATALTGPIEARLTGVVVAALKEAFDRDHARLELERAQLDEQRRRAEEALRLELRRHAADREVSRLRLVAGASFAGWIAAVIVTVVRVEYMSMLSRSVIVFAWMLLLAALGAAFMAQERVGRSVPSASPIDAGPAGMASAWLLIAGLACAAVAAAIP